VVSLEIKQLIKKLKDEEGLTIQQITDELYRKYGLKRSRQEIHRLYRASIEKYELREKISNLVARLRGMNLNGLDILKIVSKEYKNVTYYEILKIIRSIMTNGKLEEAENKIYKEVKKIVLSKGKKLNLEDIRIELGVSKEYLSDEKVKELVIISFLA